MAVDAPLLEGSTATKRMLEKKCAPILMFSLLKSEGRRAPLDVFEAGAVDFLPKRFEDISNAKPLLKRPPCEKVIVGAGLACLQPLYNRTHHSPGGAVTNGSTAPGCNGAKSAVGQLFSGNHLVLQRHWRTPVLLALAKVRSTVKRAIQFDFNRHFHRQTCGIAKQAGSGAN